MIDNVLKYVPWVFLGAGLLFFAYRFARLGFKGAVFGGKILRTFGEVPLHPRRMSTPGVIRVHEIGGSGESDIGIEIVQKSMLSYDMTGIRVSAADTTALIEVLGQAVTAVGTGAQADGSAGR